MSNVVKEKKHKHLFPNKGEGIVYSSGCMARRRFWVFGTFAAGTREGYK